MFFITYQKQCRKVSVSFSGTFASFGNFQDGRGNVKPHILSGEPSHAGMEIGLLFTHLTLLDRKNYLCLTHWISPQISHWPRADHMSMPKLQRILGKQVLAISALTGTELQVTGDRVGSSLTGKKKWCSCPNSLLGNIFWSQKYTYAFFHSSPISNYTHIH